MYIDMSPLAAVVIVGAVIYIGFIAVVVTGIITRRD